MAVGSWSARRGHRCHIVAMRASPFAERLAAAGFVVATFSGRSLCPGGCGPYNIASSLGGGRCPLQRCACTDVRRAGSLGTDGCSHRRAHTRRLCGPIALTVPPLSQQLLCVSTTAAERCLSVGVPPHMVRVVHDGVDPGRMAAGNRGAGKNSLCVPRGSCC